jgi:DNA-directed RNA polymerase specialized sigma24 family protein
MSDQTPTPEISQESAEAMLTALRNLRWRYYAACIADGKEPWVADALCAEADLAIAKARG